MTALLFMTLVSAAQLRLDFALEPSHDERDPSVVIANVSGVSFIDDRGNRRWTVPPPKTLARFMTAKAAATAYLSNPASTLDDLGLRTGATLLRDKDIILYAGEHLLVFAADTGQLSFEIGQGMTGFGALQFRHADVTFRCGAAITRRRVTHEAFLMSCNDRVLLYFVQGFAIFSTSPWKRLHTEMFPDVPQAWRYSKAGTTLTIDPVD